MGQWSSVLSAWESRCEVGKCHASTSAVPTPTGPLSLTAVQSWVLKPGAGDSFHLPCCIGFLRNMFLLLA